MFQSALPPELPVAPIVIGLVILMAVLTALLVRRPRERLPRDTCPPELVGCEIVMREGRFVGRYACHNKPGRNVMTCRRPRFLSGLPDLVVRRGASVFPVEWKTRAPGRVYDGDIAQLSVYRALLAAHPGTRWLRKPRRGYVATIGQDGTPTAWREVDLLSDRDLTYLVDHYLACARGQHEPRIERAPAAVCRRCPARDDCPL